MYIQPYKHPFYNSEERNRLKNRWIDSKTNQESNSYLKAIELINEGAGVDFLGSAFRNKELPILENDKDLRGIKLWGIEQHFKESKDCFNGIYFSYGEWVHCRFTNCIFYNCNMDFLTIFDCVFDRCTFAMTHFVGAKFENCTFMDCDFAEPCYWENGTFLNTSFKKCFLGQTTPFSECFFDDRTKITEMLFYSRHYGEKVSVPSEAMSGYFNSFMMAYEASGAEVLANEYYWQARKAYTRNNLSGWGKYFSMINELFTGYGRKPLRPLLTMIIIYFIGVSFFCLKMSFADSLLLTAGSLFTFGAGANYLENLGVEWRVFYIFLAFLGVTINAFFITTLASTWFSVKIPSQTVSTTYKHRT